MFYVTSLDGQQVEPLINIGTDFRMEQSVDGTFQVSFTCLPTNPAPENPGYDILRSESIVTIDGFDFKVKQYSDSGYFKRITAVNTFFEHSSTYVDGIFSGSHSLTNHLNYIMSKTGWSFTVESGITNVVNYIQNFGNGNVVNLLNKICKYHKVEFIINGRKSIHIAKQIGPDNDYQYRYSHNVSDVVLLEDTTSLHTYIRGFGFEGLTVEYASPNIGTFGKKEHEPIRDERFKDSVALTNYIKASITDTPELTIESRIPELTNRATGERIWLIYEPLKVSMQTRILKQTKILRDGLIVTESVTFGTTLIKTSTDILLEQQEQLNDNKELIDDTKDIIEEDIEEVVKDVNLKFEKTEEIIVDQYQTITTDYTNAISISAESIRTDMTASVENINKTIGAQYTTITEEYSSSIEQTATDLTSDYQAAITKVGEQVTEIAEYASTIEQSASAIGLSVASQQLAIDDYGTRISSAEASIMVNATAITSKVSSTDYNGETIASKIEQTSSDVTISASKINFEGHVFGEGSTWSGDVSTGSDINVGFAVRFADQTSISAGGGGLEIAAWNEISYVSTGGHDFIGDVRFHGNVSGINSGGLTAATSTSGGKSYITFRQDGSYLGMVEVS